MNEEKIRQIVRDEVARGKSGSRFGIESIARHTHNGQDSPQISHTDVLGGGCVMGRIAFAQKETYLLQLNNTFTPSRIDLHGQAVDNEGAPTIRAFIHGIAILDPAFAFQPNTTTSVVAGNVQYPLATPEFPQGNVPAQSSSYISVQNGGTFHILTGDVGHIANVEYPVGTIHARATVVGFSKSGIYVTVSNLDAGWEMDLNFTIT